MFYLWCVSATLAAVGFIVMSFSLVYYDGSKADTYAAATIPYTLFLASSALYMPLARSGYWMWTMICLFVAALSTCFLFFCAVLLFGGSYITVFVGILAFHCTVIDFMFWGFTWTYDEEII